jgi:hypothetical protein
MVKKIQLLIILIAFGMNALAQSSSDLQFIHYLIEKGEFEDAIRVCNQTLGSPLLPRKDSLNFFKGWSFYSVKSLDSASFFLGKVSPESPLIPKSVFFSAYCNAFQGRYLLSKQQLWAVPVTDSLLSELKMVQLAGISLLERDFRNFEKYASSFTHNHFSYASEEENLKKYDRDIRTHRYKSRSKAGLMSAIVPGLGKIYAGRKAQGFSAMFVTLTLGGLATENIIKSGWKSPPSLLFSGLFSVFYIGNIYGSVFAVNYVNNTYDQNINGHLLLDLHLPLRNFFR